MPPENENTKYYQFTLLYIIRGEHITLSQRDYSAYRGPKWTDQSEKQKLWNSHVAAGLSFVSTYLPPPTTYTHKSSTMLNDMQLQLSTTHRH